MIFIFSYFAFALFRICGATGSPSPFCNACTHTKKRRRGKAWGRGYICSLFACFFFYYFRYTSQVFKHQQRWSTSFVHVYMHCHVIIHSTYVGYLYTVYRYCTYSTTVQCIVVTGQPFWWGNWLQKAYKTWQEGKVSWHASIYNFFHRCHAEKSSISASWVGGISSHYYYTYTLLYKLLGEIWLHAWYTFLHHTITLSYVTSLTMHGNWILRLLKQLSVAQCL